jgi:RNA polymerase sigma-70 factor (ECF subfamily)
MSSITKNILLGDEEAIAAFYQEYSPRILRYLKNKLPQEEAKEIVNDVFLDAIEALPTIRKEENISALLYRIAHNKTVDIYRKKKIKSILLSQVPFFDMIASEIYEPEFQMEKNKLRDKIEITLHMISEKYQQILTFHYEYDIPVKELAPIFGMSVKATESLLFRARQSFIKAYERA